MKTWANIRSETLNLGFEKTKAYDKNRMAYIEAFNWAQGYIASIIGGLVDSISLYKAESTSDVVFDLVELCNDDGYNFVTIAEIGVLNGSTNERLEDYGFTGNRFLTIPASYSGAIKVYFYYLPDTLTELSEDSFEVQIPDKWAMLMPYLMANRLYLDDDASKAGYYWNLFDTAKNEIVAKENLPTVTVVGVKSVDDWSIW